MVLVGTLQKLIDSRPCSELDISARWLRAYNKEVLTQIRGK